MTVINLQADDRPRNRDGVWSTATFAALKAIIENCRRVGCMGMIVGPSGVGKTTAARAAVRAAFNAEEDTRALDAPTIAFVSMTRAAQGIQPGLLRLASGIGLHVQSHWGAHDVHEALVRHHWGRGSLIVIDEAQFMSDDLLHGIRGLWDDIEHRHGAIATVLVGTLDLASRMKAGGKKGVPFEALRGRFGASVELSALEQADYVAICNHYGLRDAQSEALIRRAAKHSGGLHNVKRLITQAERAAKNGQKIAFQDLVQAAELAGVQP